MFRKNQFRKRKFDSFYIDPKSRLDYWQRYHRRAKDVYKRESKYRNSIVLNFVILSVLPLSSFIYFPFEMAILLSLFSFYLMYRIGKRILKEDEKIRIYKEDYYLSKDVLELTIDQLNGKNMSKYKL